MTNQQATNSIKAMDTKTLISFYIEMNKKFESYMDILIEMAYTELESRLTESELLHVELEIEAETLSIEY